MSGKNEKRGLGRGLSALMADVHLAGPDQIATPRKAEQHLPVDKLEPNPQQHDRYMDYFALYRQLYAHVKGDFVALAALRDKYA